MDNSTAFWRCGEMQNKVYINSKIEEAPHWITKSLLWKFSMPDLVEINKVL